MTDRPVIFSAPMVRALLAGTKTQTRRIIGAGTSLLDGGPWPRGHRAQSWAWDRAWVDPGPSPAGNAGPYLKVPRDDDETVHRVYPIWWPGMRLWVREAAWICPPNWTDTPANPMGPHRQEVAYNADDVRGGTAEAARDYKLKLRPSIHVPRWASRLTLTVTDVRVQRLQDISEEDARAEGVATIAPPDPRDGARHFGVLGVAAIDRLTASKAFADLWNSINGPGAWQANPWVAAISFTVERRNIDA